jgi:hypothetical protein
MCAGSTSAQGAGSGAVALAVGEQPAAALLLDLPLVKRPLSSWDSRPDPVRGPTLTRLARAGRPVRAKDFGKQVLTGIDRPRDRPRTALTASPDFRVPQLALERRPVVAGLLRLGPACVVGGFPSWFL